MYLDRIMGAGGASKGGTGMFERLTDRARRVMDLAQDEARRLQHNYIGTEHLLLGLLGEGEGVAAQALESLGIGLAAARQQVEQIVGRGQQAAPEHRPAVVGRPPSPAADHAAPARFLVSAVGALAGPPELLAPPS